MALITLDGTPVVEAVISLPRCGVWVARLVMAADTTPDAGGQATLDVAGGQLQLVGTVTPRTGVEAAQGHVQLVGGAGKLKQLASPKWYHQQDVPTGLTLRIVLADLLDPAGEQLDAGADAAVLNTTLASWTTWQQPTATMLDALLGAAAPEGTVWRITPGGKLWLGTDSWPQVKLEGAAVMQEHPREGRVVLAVEAPTLLPGVTLDPDLGISWGSGRASYVEHRVAAGAVRTTIWTD